jgi:hypothetical protein
VEIKKALSDFVHRRPSIASHQKAISFPILCEHPDLAEGRILIIVAIPKFII